MNEYCINFFVVSNSDSRNGNITQLLTSEAVENKFPLLFFCVFCLQEHQLE